MMQSKISLSLYTILLTIILSVSADYYTFPEGFHLTRMAGGIEDGTSFVFHPTEDAFYYLEKAGRIFVVRDGTKSDTAVLDIREKIQNLGESGLLTMIFDPDFASNTYIYLYYTSSDTVVRNVVSRFTMVSDVIDPDSEQVIIQLDPITSFIEMGGLLMEKDDKLLVFTGDAQNYGSASRLDSLHGKVLRYNFDGTIPSDNPFYDILTGNYRAIVAYGLRNPFSGDIQPGTDRIYWNDVGEKKSEEVNELTFGQFYGWPVIEGKLDTTEKIAAANYEDPVFYYNHGDAGYCAIVGGAFYPSSSAPFPTKYQGKYFLGDFCQGNIRVFNPTTKLIEEVFATNLNYVITYKVDSNGDFYFLSRGTSSDASNAQPGEIFKVEYTGDAKPTLAYDISNVKVTVGEPVAFAVLASGKHPMTYQWKVNGQAIAGATSPVYEIKQSTSSMNGKVYTVTVTNSAGSVTSSSSTVTVLSNKNFKAVITAPVDGSTYASSSSITYAGSLQGDDSPYANSMMTWKVIFHHDSHYHILLDETSGSAGGTVTLSFDEGAQGVYYEFILTGVDASGRVSTASSKIYPKYGQISLKTDPAGLALDLDLQKVEPPYTIKSTQGVTRKLEAPEEILKNGVYYEFSSWSDGSARSHDITIPTDGSVPSLTAYYIPTSMVTRGVNYYYKQATFTALPDFEASTLASDPILYFDINVRDNDKFAIKFVTHFEVKTDGKYTFHVKTNGGVSLALAANQLILQETLPTATTDYSGSTDLGKGYVLIELSAFFNHASATPVFEVTYEGPGISKQRLPYSSLYVEDPNPCLTQLNYFLPGAEEVTYDAKNPTTQGYLMVRSDIIPNFKVEGPATLGANAYADGVLTATLTGVPGKVTVSVYHDGTATYCPAKTVYWTFTVKNPDYVPPAEETEDDGTSVGGYIAAVVILSLLVAGLGVYVFKLKKELKRVYKKFTDYSSKPSI